MKSLREKLEFLKEPKVVPVPAGRQKQWGTGSLLIPRGVDVDAAVREVRLGELIAVGALRVRLAREHGADVACPLVTGMCLRIAAELAIEEEWTGSAQVTPFWRVVRDDGRLLDKMPGGEPEQARRLIAEGHTILRGKKMRVQDWTTIGA